MGRITTRLCFSLLLLSGLWSGSLILGGCDASENQNLLNPPLPDSSFVRVVNLIAGRSVSLTLSTLPAATNLAPFEVSNFAPFFFREQFPIYLSGDGKVDTIRDQRLPSGVKTAINVTYLVTGTDTSRQLLTLYTSSSERSELMANGNGRIYFINAVPGKNFLLKRGCRAGDTLYPTLTEFRSGGIKDVPMGEYALYLFETDGTTETASAHLQIEAGKVLFLIAMDRGNGPGLYMLDAETAGMLTQMPPETRTMADLEILNGLDGPNITPFLVGVPSPLVPNIPSGEVSSSVSIEACTDSNGDTLQVITDQDDTSNVPIRVGVGSNTLAAVYSDGSKTRILALDRTTFTPSSGKVYIRGVNLSPASKNAAVVIGAGGPQGVTPDFRPFGSLQVGQQSGYVALPEGLYPLSLEQASTGIFLDGGLQQLDPGFYTMLILQKNGSPALYILRDDVPGSKPQPLQAQGRTVLFFSMIPGTLVRFEIPTSISAQPLRIDSVPYSYVFQTILPEEHVTITAPGVGQTSIDLTTESYTVGATGTPDNGQIISFPRPPAPTDLSKANIRFLNAVPGSSPLNIYISSDANPIATGLSFGTPSTTTSYDPRRYSFTITASAGDTVAAIQGVQLSGGRNYLLIIGPKGATSSSSSQYGTLWMQE